MMSDCMQCNLLWDYQRSAVLTHTHTHSLSLTHLKHTNTLSLSHTHSTPLYSSIHTSITPQFNQNTSIGGYPKRRSPHTVTNTVTQSHTHTAAVTVILPYSLLFDQTNKKGGMGTVKEERERQRERERKREGVCVCVEERETVGDWKEIERDCALHCTPFPSLHQPYITSANNSFNRTQSHSHSHIIALGVCVCASGRRERYLPPVQHTHTRTHSSHSSHIFLPKSIETVSL